MGASEPEGESEPKAEPTDTSPDANNMGGQGGEAWMGAGPPPIRAAVLWRFRVDQLGEANGETAPQQAAMTSMKDVRARARAAANTNKKQA